MNYENLHSSVLERLFGSISLEIIKQDENIRIIKLVDKKNITRTIGIVKFLKVNSLKKNSSKNTFRQTNRKNSIRVKY